MIRARRLGASWTILLVVSTMMALLSCRQNFNKDGGDWRADPKYVQLQLQEVELLRQLTRCLGSYADARGGFPATLAAIGPAGTGCADAQLVKDQLPKLSVRYRPGSPGRQGLATSYLVDLSSHGFRSIHMRSDETGMRFLFYGRKPSLSYDSLTEYYIGDIALAAERYCSSHPSTGYPAAMADLKLPFTGEVAAGLRAGRLDGIRYTYSPGERGPDGRVSRYRLEVGPIRYVHPPQLSYLVTSDRTVRTTNRDRPAEPSDPVQGWLKFRLRGVLPCGAAH